MHISSNNIKYLWQWKVCDSSTSDSHSRDHCEVQMSRWFLYDQLHQGVSSIFQAIRRIVEQDLNQTIHQTCLTPWIFLPQGIASLPHTLVVRGGRGAMSQLSIHPFSRFVHIHLHILKHRDNCQGIIVPRPKGLEPLLMQHLLAIAASCWHHGVHIAGPWNWPWIKWTSD